MLTLPFFPLKMIVENYTKKRGVRCAGSFFMPKRGDYMKNFEMRCGSCGKLLAKTNGNTEIVCPRCGAMNTYDPKTNTVDCKQRKKNAAHHPMFR